MAAGVAAGRATGDGVAFRLGRRRSRIEDFRDAKYFLARARFVWRRTAGFAGGMARKKATRRLHKNPRELRPIKFLRRHHHVGGNGGHGRVAGAIAGGRRAKVPLAQRARDAAAVRVGDLCGDDVAAAGAADEVLRSSSAGNRTDRQPVAGGSEDAGAGKNSCRQRRRTICRSSCRNCKKIPSATTRTKPGRRSTTSSNPTPMRPKQAAEEALTENGIADAGGNLGEGDAAGGGFRHERSDGFAGGAGSGLDAERGKTGGRNFERADSAGTSGRPQRFEQGADGKTFAGAGIE